MLGPYLTFSLSSKAARDCWTVAFGNAYTDEDRCLAAGYDNGDVKLFDLRTQTMRWETNVKNGVTGLDFDRNDIEMNKVGGFVGEAGDGRAGVIQLLKENYTTL